MKFQRARVASKENIFASFTAWVGKINKLLPHFVGSAATALSLAEGIYVQGRGERESESSFSSSSNSWELAGTRACWQNTGGHGNKLRMMKNVSV